MKIGCSTSQEPGDETIPSSQTLPQNYTAPISLMVDILSVNQILNGRRKHFSGDVMLNVSLVSMPS